MKFCKKCKCDTERYAGGKCMPCAKAYAATWQAANPDRKKANNAAWHAANKDEVKAYKSARYESNADEVKAKATAWAAANPERKKANNIAWCAANPERKKATDAAWYAANLDRAKAASAAWQAANPEVTRIYNQNRRARKRANGGILFQGLSAKLFKLQRGKCACCGLPLGDNFHLDHIMPIVLGGSNTDNNMQLLRQRCNNQKHAKHPIDFMQSRGFLL